MREIVAIIQNEWIKLLRRRRFLVVLLLSLAVVGLFSVGSYYEAKQMERYNSPEYQQQMLEDQLRHLDEMIADENIPAADKEHMKLERTNTQERLDRVKSGQPAGTKMTSEMLRTQIEQIKENIKNLPPDQKWQSGDMEQQILTYEYYIARDMTPNLEDFRPASSWQMIETFLMIGAMVLFPLLAVLLVADMVSGEMTGGTIKLLLARPASRSKILFGKYITSLIASIILIALLLGALTGAMFALFGTDGYEHPKTIGVRHYEEQVMMGGQMQTIFAVDASNAKVIPLGTFVLNGMLLTVAATVAMTTLGFFCSTMVRSAAVSTGLAMGVVVCGTIVTQVAMGSEWLKWLPTTHFNLPSIYSGEVGQMFRLHITLGESALWLIGWTVALYLIGQWRFTKQDLLG